MVTEEQDRATQLMDALDEDLPDTYLGSFVRAVRRGNDTNGLSLAEVLVPRLSVESVHVAEKFMGIFRDGMAAEDRPLGAEKGTNWDYTKALSIHNSLRQRADLPQIETSSPSRSGAEGLAGRHR